MTFRRRLLTAGALAPLAGLAHVALAQNTAPLNESGLEEIFVTATKQAAAVAAQDVALAITAYSGEQLEGAFARDLQSLSMGMPNVQLDSINTQKATANFAMRGLGVNSSIPSIEPTVGVFYDGVYLGINAGVVYDFFDLEGIEVLRGPQGLLFGRNVTGGAVVMRTRRPTDEFESKVKVSVTDDMDNTVAASVSGPLVEGTLKARLTAMYNDDQGWFKNEFTGDDFGASETWLVRPSLVWTPHDATDITLRLEHGEYDGDGSASQNDAPGIPASQGGPHNRHTHSISFDEEGLQEGDWDFAALEINIDIGPGTLTNILGWRDYEEHTVVDIDGRITTAFHAASLTDHDQLSNELRYAAEFSRLRLTTGLYWFTQDLSYFETRLLNTNPSAAPAAQVLGHLGGVQESTTKGVFASVDVDLTDALVLNLGARYTKEEKDAAIATFGAAPTAGTASGTDPCPAARAGGLRDETPSAGSCTLGFRDSEEWSDVTPKVGLQYVVNDDLQLYTFATKGFRSGGYNLRNTAVGASPGPFEPEEQLSYELGTKADWIDGRLRTNFALFYNEIEDMQREVNLPLASAGVAQIIDNTADATIQGVELEVLASVTPNLLLSGNVGYIDGEYDKGSIRFDLNGDLMVNDVDAALDIPRLAPLTWGVGFTLDLPLGGLGTLTSKVDFNHRDRSAYTDNNLGTLNTVDQLNASFSLLTLDDQLTLSLFGKNLTDQVIDANDTQLPPIAAFGGPGASYRPLARGRVYGLELVYKL